MPNQHLLKLTELNTILKEELGEGEELTPEDFKEIQIKPPNRPDFPSFILLLALFKDFSDLVSFGFLGPITNIFASIAIRIWLMGKVSFMKRWLYKRYIFALILGFIPGLNMIPEWTVFVLRGHAKEYKKIDSILNALESFAEKMRGG